MNTPRFTRRTGHRLPPFAAPIAVLCAIAGTLVGCQSTPDKSTTQVAAQAPLLFEGMGSHTRDIAASNPRAQQFFNQGLNWTFAFNHDEAERSFREAARLDPANPMPWWGIALVNGPHINNPEMSAEQSRKAWEALGEAQARAGAASGANRALIEALAHRYESPAPADRAGLNRRYADAMRAVWAAYPGDDDVGVLYAESLMDLRPWDLWALDGTPRPETPIVVETLEAVLVLNPNHPGACHLYIHAVEASPNPAKADVAANTLRNLVPASSHMVHMPSHIDVRMGRWALAADTNARAASVDARYRKLSPKQGFYRFYMVHNQHFFAYTCMMEGRSKDAIETARAVAASAPPDMISEMAPVLDGYMTIDLEALKRFGKWDELLNEPKPPQYFPVKTSIWHADRAVAFAAKGDTASAEQEQALFREAVKKVPKDARVGNSPAVEVLAVADHVVAGEIAYRKGQIDTSISELRAAIKIEDGLRYDEPPDWMVPARHTLGAVLVSANRIDEAEKVYREDLARWPENGWSLHGLHECLERQGSPEAAAVEARFRKAWSRSDTKITSSCLCVTMR